jgi:acyl carrier protein
VPVPRDDIDSEVRAFLKRNAPGNEAQVEALAGDAIIWGVIDSLLVLDLVLYLEKRFDLVVLPDHLTPENFSTVDAIVAYLLSRLES